jgi:hypothetical protein
MATVTTLIPSIKIDLGDGFSKSKEQKIVAICSVKERVFIATEQRIYELIDEIWQPMVFYNE